MSKFCFFSPIIYLVAAFISFIYNFYKNSFKMNNIQNHITKIVEHYPLENTPFFEFCEQADREEFLKGQEPFFYAVEAFPRMLCLLGSKIQNSHTRLSIIHNLWEEHGHGDKNLFHTETYQRYLVSLGKDPKEKIQDHPAVTFWIESMLKSQDNACIYAIKLCAIEYIYTRISNKILDTINKNKIFRITSQDHYQKHEVLDETHAQELLQIALNEQKLVQEEDMIEAFKKSIDAFIIMLNQISPVTHKQINNFSKEKIAFFYSRESSEPEIATLSKIGKKNPNILIVCSGGEHIFRIKKFYPNAKITALDINNYQIKLTKNKLNSKEPLVFNQGKFEKIFEQLANRLFIKQNSKLICNINENDYIHKLCENDPLATSVFLKVCQNVFSKNVLEGVFTKDATRFSSKHFSNHFYQVLLRQLQSSFENPRAVGFNLKCIMGIEPVFNDSITNKNKINFYNGTFPQFFKENADHFDLISLSNIGDWMEQAHFQSILQESNSHLSDQGHVISRKLLGDYKLKETMHDIFGNTSDMLDSTEFYTEVISSSKFSGDRKNV